MFDRLLDATILFSFDATGFRRHARRFRAEDLAVDLSGRRYVVTGANSGIGLETARGLVQRGGEVLLLCRSAERGEAAAVALRSEVAGAQVSVIQVDMSELDAVDAAAAAVGAGPLHGLVHNAGALPHTRDFTRTGMERLCALHVVGPYRLSMRLQEALALGGGRTVFVSSGGMYTQRLDVSKLDDRTGPWDGVKAYARTKRAQVVLAAELDARFGGVHAMHPGWADTPGVVTSLPGFHARMQRRLRTSAEGADTVLWLVACPTLPGEGGGFWFDRRRVSPYLVGKRESAAERARLMAWLAPFA